jgi:hypothetical protein
MKSAMRFGLVLSVLFLVGAAGVSVPQAYAHCDTMNGPVIMDARTALESKDVTPVLKWVSKEKEAGVRDAFESAVAERAKGPEAAQKADTKFFEELVRIHREGEGAPFTGLKAGDAVEPAEAHADMAIEAGSVDALAGEMAKHLTEAVKARFDRVLEKKAHMNESVEAGREYVAAYVEYLHYVAGVHKVIAGEASDHHGD